jgi:drug/metabolite transporter (DMT)-like permease
LQSQDLPCLRRTKGRQAEETGLSRSDSAWLAGTVGFGGIPGLVRLLFGFNLTKAASPSLLLNLETVFTLTLAWMMFCDYVDSRLFLGALR